MNIGFTDFDMDKSIIAPVIYGAYPHQTTNRGVKLSQAVSAELKRFLSEFNVLSDIEQIPYYRIDAYFSEDTLWILEINAAFVDGWGTALNLARASGIYVVSRRLVLPQRFATIAQISLPELELFVRELATFGVVKKIIRDWSLISNGLHPTYVYGRVRTEARPYILPYDGLRLDNKLNLGLFSQIWNGVLVRTPRHYISRFQTWDEVPTDVVLKFCDKGGPE